MKIREEQLTAVGDIQGELLERKALPIGRTQFDEWAERIIKAAAIDADHLSQKACLAGMLMTLGPTEAFKEDGYYALALRTDAVKTTAIHMRAEIDNIRKKRLEEQNQKSVAEIHDPSKNGSPLGLLEN